MNFKLKRDIQISEFGVYVGLWWLIINDKSERRHVYGRLFRWQGEWIFASTCCKLKNSNNESKDIPEKHTTKLRLPKELQQELNENLDGMTLKRSFFGESQAEKEQNQEVASKIVSSSVMLPMLYFMNNLKDIGKEMVEDEFVGEGIAT